MDNDLPNKLWDDAELLVRKLLLSLPQDLSSEVVSNTPKRVVKHLLKEMYGVPQPKMTVFHEDSVNSMVIQNLIPFSSSCVPSRQIIATANRGNLRAQAISVDDELYSLDDGKVVTTKVVSVKSKPTRELVKVVTTEGNFVVTPDHPLGALTQWIEAKDSKGCYIEWADSKSLCSNHLKITPGYDFGFALGAIFSDGTTYKNRYVSLVVNDKPFAERFAKCMNVAFGITAELERCSRPSGFLKKQVPGWRVRICSSYLARLIRQYAGGDSNHLRQQFPDVVTYSVETMRGFLDGYYEGDGDHWKGRPNGRIIVSANRDFLLQLSSALGRAKPTCHRTSSGCNAMYIPECWDSGRKFRDWHGFSPDREVQLPLIEGHLVKVLDVIPIKAEGKKPFTVYSWQCRPYPSFLISGHHTHNCEHHMLPFFGTATVAYIPNNGRIVGLSKLARLVQFYAQGLQVQERITHRVGKHLAELKDLHPLGVAVSLQAVHSCMSCRGVRALNTVTMTQFLYGEFETNPATRQEFFSLVKH